MSDPQTTSSLPYASPTSETNQLAVTLGVVGLKVLGVSYLASCVVWLPTLVSTLITEYGNARSLMTSMSVMHVGSLSANSTVGLVLLWKADVISRRVLGNLPADARLPLNVVELTTIAVFAVGLIGILNAIPQVISFAATLLAEKFGRRVLFTVPTSNLFTRNDIVGPLGQFVGGIVLVFFARRIAKWGTKMFAR